MVIGLISLCVDGLKELPGLITLLSPPLLLNDVNVKFVDLRLEMVAKLFHV